MLNLSPSRIRVFINAFLAMKADKSADAQPAAEAASASGCAFY
jgi:hypothetical protein